MRIPSLVDPSARAARLLCAISLLIGAPAALADEEAAANADAPAAAEAPPGEAVAGEAVAGEAVAGDNAQVAPASSGDNAQGEAAPSEAREAGETGETAAPADTAPTEAASADAPHPAIEDSAPPASGWSKDEGQRLVGYVATGVAIAAGATGLGLGMLAQGRYDCLQDASKCDGGQPVGAEFQRAQGEVAQLAAIGDMLYVVAGASAVAAVTGYVAGFLFPDETEGLAAAPSAEAAVTSPVAMQSGGAR